MNKKIIFIILDLIIISITVSIIYFRIDNTNNVNSNTKETKQFYNFNHFKPKISDNYSYESDMTWLNKIYYKKISTYNEYLIYKEKWNDILDMSENDFETKFMILTVIENTSMTRLTIGEIYNNSDTLYIGLAKVPYTKNFDESKTGISIIIDKEFEKENVDVFKTVSNSEFSSQNDTIKQLSENYSREKAISDKCIVNFKENIELFEQFMKNVENNISDEIRFYNDQDYYIHIMDISYLADEDKFVVCQDTTRNTEKNSTYNYYEYDKLEFVSSDNNFSTYIMTNSETNENDIYIYIVNT